MKNLKKRKDEKRASPAKWKQICERAGELATNHGKRAQEPTNQEMQHAKRELLNMKITSPKA